MHHLHTTTGVTATGFLASGAVGAASGGAVGDAAAGQLPPMGNRRGSHGLIAAIGAPELHRASGGDAAATAAGGGATAPSPLGRTVGLPSHVTGAGTVNVNVTPRNQIIIAAGGGGGATGGGGLRSPPTSSPGGASAASALARISAAGGGVVAAAAAAAAAGVAAAAGGAAGRPGGRALSKEAAQAPRKVAAVDNIAEALGRFFQESMDLAPKPPPRPPSSSSSDNGDPGPLSSDDEGTQEELDVLEKLYLVMPNLESPGRGATSSRGLSSSRPVLSSNPPSRPSGGSFTAVATPAIGSRPVSPTQRIASFTGGATSIMPPGGRMPPLPGNPAAAAAAASGGGGTAISRSVSPSPLPPPSAGSSPSPLPGQLAPLDGAVAAAAKRKAAMSRNGRGASAPPPPQPAFLPSKAVLQFHQRALGITLPLGNSGGAGGGGGAAGTAAGAGGAGPGAGGASAAGGGGAGPFGPSAAATAGVSGPYGSLSQPPDAPVTNTYVNRDADYLMMRQMVEAALAAGQSRPPTAGPAVAAASAAAAAGLPVAAVASARGALPSAASPSRRGGASGRAGSAKKSAGGKKGAVARKTKLPPTPPQLLPRPAVPIHLQHLVRPGSASVGALMGLHQPAGIDPAIIAAVMSGRDVDPVQGLAPPPGSAGGGGGLGGASIGSPTRALSPVRPLSPVRQVQPSGGASRSAASSRPASPLRPARAAANASAAAAAREESVGRGSGGGAAAAAAAAAGVGGSARDNRSGSTGAAKSRSRNASPTNRGTAGGGTTLPPARPQSGNGRALARHASVKGSNSRPYTAPGNGNWAATRLERLRGAAATKAAACASMSPLRASLAAPISGLTSRRHSRPLTEVEFGVFHRTMDAALMPLTRAAAKLGTYGEALPPPNLFAALAAAPAKPPPQLLLPPPPAPPVSLPLPTVAGPGAASGGGADGADVSRAPSSSRSAAVVAAAALAGATTSAVAAAAAEGGGVAAGSALSLLDEAPRRKLKRRNLGGWDWPPGQGAAPAYDVLEETRHAMAAVLAGAEVDEDGRTGPCDRVGEVGRLMRRFQKQDNRTSFNLSHAVNGIDQIVALVDVLGHPDLACVCELLLAGNALNDEAFTPLGARLASAECGSLRRLDVCYNNLTAASVELLLPLLKDEVAAMSKAQRIRRGLDSGTALHGVLHRLVLDGNPVGDAGAELLCDAASSDYTHLAELRMARCGLGERGAAAAGRLLENSSAIRILDLSWNTLGKRGGQALGEGLRNAGSIQQLYVAWTGITDVGASHIAKALKGNATLQVLDMSGDSVSGDTSLVLLDSLAENGCLTTLVLRDNPVGVVAARKLLKALHQGVIEAVDLLGCSFGGMGNSTVVWDPHDPDGVYDLDLETPAHYQVAVELVGLAAHMGLRSWRAATLNGKPFRLNSTNKLQLPVRGRLHVEFVSCTPLVRDDGPLTDGEVRSMWFCIADPDGVRTPQGPMLLTEDDPAAAAAAAGNGAGGIAGGSPKRLNRLPTSGGSGALLPKKSPRGAAAGAGAAKAAGSAGGGKGGKGGGGAGRGLPGGTDISSATELKGATDEWKLQLLEALVTDVYLTCAQLKHMLRTFDGRDARTEAVVQAFGVLADTENFWAVLDELEPGSREQVESRLGKVRMFFPENPTGRYTLMLSQLPHQCVAKQLLQQYVQQYDNKLTHHPNRVCFTACVMDGVPTDVSDPHKLYLPQEGILELCFVDLRSPPPGTRSLSRAQFAVLVSHLVHQDCLDPVGICRIIDHPALLTAVGALRRWEAWTRRHPISANVPYLWKAIHEIRRRDDPEGAAAAEAEYAAAFAAATGAGGGSGGASGAAAGAAAPSARRETVSSGVGEGGAAAEPPATPGSGSSRPTVLGAAALSRLPRESSSYAGGGVRPLGEGGGAGGSAGPDTPNRRSTYGLRESAYGVSPESQMAVGTGPGDAPLSQRSNQGAGGGGGKSGGGRPRTAPTGPPPLYVRDMGRYVETIRILSVRHYLTCWQLIQLIQLLPPTATDERVETVTAFWARVTDRDGHWVDVMRSLTNDQQVRACQRLGYMNVYSENRPAMHYRLRMYKEDEHELAWQLYNKSLDSPLPCWKSLTIDDQPKRVNQGVNMWTVLRGNAADGTTPQTTLEFDFVWPDEDAQRTLAARQVQRAWRLFKNPKGGGAAVVPHTRGTGATQPRFVAFSKKKKTNATSKMNDPGAGRKK